MFSFVFRKIDYDNRKVGGTSEVYSNLTDFEQMLLHSQDVMESRGKVSKNDSQKFKYIML